MYISKINLLFVLVLLICYKASAQPCKCNRYIRLNDNYVDGYKLGVQPGDTICIEAGKKKYLNLFNFYGSKEAPIVFINFGGQVEIGDPTWHYGCVIGKSAHFILTGTGDPQYEYGIRINQTKEGASGLAIGASDFDVNHIEVSHTGFAGIMAKIDPNCDTGSWQEHFLMQNVSFHHNYVHDTGGEGMYIGFTGSAKNMNCDGKELLIQPHNIENIKVYKNKIENTGWDGIQVARAVKNCEIYDNQVLQYGIKNENWQKAGIVIGGGTTGKLYNNIIHTGTGGGIHVFGAGENLIYNNIIIDAGEDGIYCRNLYQDEEKKFGYVFINNTIIHPKRYGFKAQNLPNPINRFYNNLIIQPQKQFISVTPQPSWVESHNYFDTSTLQISAKPFFVSSSSNYNNSYLIDKGKDVSQWDIYLDYSGNARPSGNAYDIGAYEFTGK